MAMAISEAGWFDRIAIKITATDLSHAALFKARQGLFRERSFRNLPVEKRDKFFEKEGNLWRVDPALHSRIRWESANLIDHTDIARFGAVPFILCRNVFIYFSKETIRRVVRLMAESIQPPGYLLVGVSESLLKISSDFELTYVGNAFAYRRSKPQNHTANKTTLSFGAKGQE